MDTAGLPAYALRALAEATKLYGRPNDKCTYTIVAVIPGAPVPTVAPNGSSRGTDYRTAVILRQDWRDTTENGIYAGRSYRVGRTYHSSFPDGAGTISISSSSQPWKD